VRIKCDFLILPENILHPSKDSTEFLLIFFASKSFMKIRKFESYEPQITSQIFAERNFRGLVGPTTIFFLFCWD